MNGSSVDDKIPNCDPPLTLPCHAKKALGFFETVLIDEHQQQQHSGFCIDSGSVYLFHEEKENELNNVCLKKKHINERNNYLYKY